jgi:tetratricopeptide (TPR) repeat protein
MLLQVGPMPSTGPVSAVPEELYEQRRLNRARAAAIDESRPDDPVRACFVHADADAETARANYAARLNAAAGTDRAVAAHCLGYALSALERWDEAAEAFARGKDALPSDDIYRTRLGAATAAARLAGGRPEAALAELDALTPPADARLATLMSLDRARALVALGRNEEAAAALAQARATGADNDEAWLLSATLARRTERLDEAQQFIERAAALRPAGPEIGLEAGVIAMLAGREEAALASWRSVVATAPGTPAAATATDYIAQVTAE